MAKRKNAEHCRPPGKLVVDVRLEIELSSNKANGTEDAVLTGTVVSGTLDAAGKTTPVVFRNEKGKVAASFTAKKSARFRFDGLSQDIWESLRSASPAQRDQVLKFLNAHQPNGNGKPAAPERQEPP